MANAVYPKAKEAMLSGAVNVISSTIKIQLLADDAEYDATDTFLSNIIGTRVGSPVTITGKTVTNGEFKGSNGAFNPPNGFVVLAAVVYIDTGVTSTSRALAWLDTKADTAALEFQTIGEPVQIFWNDPYFSIGG